MIALLEHLNDQIRKISKELSNGEVKISNLDKLLENSLKKLGNISKIWVSSELEEKRMLHKTLFPDGIYYDVENNQYLTKNTNKFIKLIDCIFKQL